MIQLAETTLAPALEAAAPSTPEITPIERADRKANARGKSPKVVKNRIKPAAATPAPVKKKPEAKPSEMVAQIRAACTALKITIKEFGSGSFVLRLPEWAEFKKQLPETGAMVEVKLFHKLREAVVILTGDAKSTWVMHRTGSFAFHGKFSK
jgi:hypothetical protein